MTVCQQGDRLGHCRPQSRDDRYVPSPFSLLMIDLDSGNIIESSRENTRQNFFHTLLINKPIMDKGNYLLVIDVCWDESVHLDPGYDDILVRAYSIEPVILNKIDENEGRDYLREALKLEGKHTKNKQHRQYYRESDAEYGQQVYRVSDPSTNVGYYSFVYRANNSRYGSTEKFKLSLTGLDFVGYVEEDFETIESGTDNIIVMRCQEAFGSTGFGMSYAMQARGMSEAEIVEKCKQEAVKQLTNDVTYQMMLTSIGGCILFHVHDTNKGRKITVDIEGSQNLRVEDGDTFLKKTVEVGSGQQKACILKTIQQGAGVSLAISFGCSMWAESRSQAQREHAPHDQWNDFVDRCWPRYDRDDDGHLSKNEAIRFFSNTFSGTHPSQFDRLFTVFDTNGDGQIDKQEAAQFLRENAQ